MSVEHMPDERLVRYYENVRTKIRYDFAYCARARGRNHGVVQACGPTTRSLANTTFRRRRYKIELTPRLAACHFCGSAAAASNNGLPNNHHGRILTRYKSNGR